MGFVYLFSPSTDVPIPAGLIAVWAGLLADIPSGWVLCDGTLGTPDLRARFVKGAAAGNNPGATGGAATHTHAGHAAHVFTQPSGHSDHVFTQPSGHSAHVFTQPSGHSAHVFTQPSSHSNHAALAGHAHELPFIFQATQVHHLDPSVFGTGTSRTATRLVTSSASSTSAAVALSESVAAGTPDAHSAHAGGAVDAHSAHAGGAVDAHSAHAGGAVDAHSAHDTPNSEPAYYEVAYIYKT